MFTEERQNAIEKCLREKGKVRVKELSEMFQVICCLKITQGSMAFSNGRIYFL